MHRMFSPEGKLGGVRRMFLALLFSCTLVERESKVTKYH